MNHVPKEYLRKKIADALGEPESAEPIRNIRLHGNNRLTLSLGKGDAERRFSFEKYDDTWGFSGQLIDK